MREAAPKTFSCRRAPRAVGADETYRSTLKEQSTQLLAMLWELRKAKDLAEEAATSLQKDERKIDKLRVAFSTALQGEQARATPASPSAERLEEAVNCIDSSQYLSEAAGLHDTLRRPCVGAEHRASASQSQRGKGDRGRKAPARFRGKVRGAPQARDGPRRKTT
jgi:hypothetical protein